MNSQKPTIKVKKQILNRPKTDISQKKIKDWLIIILEYLCNIVDYEGNVIT